MKKGGAYFLSIMESEPSARWFHAALSTGQNMLVLAGDGGRRSSVDSSIVESFNVSLSSWQPQRHLLNQTLPDGYCRMAATSDGENVYMFAGRSGSRQLCNKIFEINTVTLECSELLPATPVCPTPKEFSTLIYWNEPSFPTVETLVALVLHQMSCLCLTSTQVRQ